MITPVLPDQPSAQAPQPGPEEPPAQMPAWMASFTDVLTGLANRLQFHQPPHPAHHSPPPKETEAEQLMSADDGIDVQSPPPPPPDDNNNNININKVKSVKKEKSRTNIKLTRDADMSDNSDDEGSDISEHTHCSKRARLSDDFLTTRPVSVPRHNRYLQGLDKATKPSEVDCSSKRL